jgi:hypothetical protein
LNPIDLELRLRREKRDHIVVTGDDGRAIIEKKRILRCCVFECSSDSPLRSVGGKCPIGFEE